MRNRRLIMALTLLVSLPCLCRAWAGTEHKLMAYIASEHLTPATQAVLDRYLDQSICEYASWMDRYRNSEPYAETTYWHMMTFDKDWSMPAGHEGKACQALRNAVDVLSNYKEHTDSTVFINLMYVIHLVPETHCPSHIYFLEFGDDAAAKKADFYKYSYDGVMTTYHSMWDSSMTRLYPGLNLDQYKAIYDTWTPEKQKECSDGQVEDWMRDNAKRCRQIYDWVTPDSKIGIDFLRSHQDLLLEQIPRAGYRLARLLNTLFGNEQ